VQQVPVQTGGTPTGSSQDFVYDRAALSGAAAVGPAKFTSLGVDVALKLRNPDGLIAYAQHVSDPASANYRQFLTPSQIADRFGASAQDEAAARAYFERYGLAVAHWPQRLMLRVTGSQNRLEAAFNTRFGIYRRGSSMIVAPLSAPRVPLHGLVTGSPDIVAWSGRFGRPFLRSQSAGGGLTFGYSPQQVANVFDFNGAYAAGFNGSGINIGVIGTGGVALQGAPNGHGGTFNPGDVEALRALFGVAGSSKVMLPVFSGAGFATPLPVTATVAGACTTDPSQASSINQASGFPFSISPTAACNPEDTEAQIDTEQTALLARSATIDFYLGYNPSAACPSGDTCNGASKISAQGLLEINAEVQQALADQEPGSVNYANAPDILSLSIGESEASAQSDGDAATLRTAFAALVTAGVAVFVSSGDDGAQSCQFPGSAGNANGVCTSYPATDPSVVAVGGLTVPLDGGGNPAGPITGWGVQTSGGLGGSGGGLSTLAFNAPAPAFQSGLTYPAPGPTSVALAQRAVPDVALLGDPATGVAVIMDADPSLGGFATSPFSPVGGTSVAAPQMAAMWALVLQACSTSSSCAGASGIAQKYRLGNPNPLLYKIYGQNTGALYQSVFNDILYGTNQQQCTGSSCAQPLDGGYIAGPGFDLVTGLGQPSARSLIKAVTGV
jgi:subtilase family serine protease